jgi:hypothetical protein
MPYLFRSKDTPADATDIGINPIYTGMIGNANIMLDQPTIFTLTQHVGVIRLTHSIGTGNYARPTKSWIINRSLCYGSRHCTVATVNRGFKNLTALELLFMGTVRALKACYAIRNFIIEQGFTLRTKMQFGGHFSIINGSFFSL